MRSIVALLLLLAVPAHAYEAYSGYDAVDADAGTAQDTLEATETGTANEDEDIQSTNASAEIRKANNGGGGNSAFSRKVNVANSEQAYDPYTVVSTPELTVGSSLYVVTIPSGSLASRRIFDMREDSNSDGVGDQDGCGLDLLVGNAGSGGRAVRLTYRGGVNVGQSIEKFQTSTCCPVAGDCLFRNECTVNGDCPSQAPTCTCAGDGRGCYHGYWEVHQKTVSATQVQCDLWIDGRLTVASGIITTTGAGPVAGYRLGATGTEAKAVTFVLDDRAHANAARVYPGYTSTAVVSRDGATLKWSEDCAGTAHYGCIDDFLAGGSYDEPSRNTVSSANRRDDFSAMTPAPSVRAGESIRAADSVLIGTTNATAGTRAFDLWHRTCVSAASCTDVAPVQFSIPVNETSNVWTRVLQRTTPSGGQWTTGTAAQAAWSISTVDENPPTSRLSAAVTYWRIQQPDEPLPITLSDHNKGNDDGLFCVASAGDSTNAASVTATCPSGLNEGDPCTFQDYCSWDSFANGGFADHPTGGCNADDAVCVTCTVRDVANGIWYPCEADADCSSGTCSCSTPGCGGSCSQNGAIPCDSNDDCSKGTCDTTATCVDSCENADCPTRASWGASIPDTLGATQHTKVAVGGQTSAGFLATVPDLLDGKSTAAEIISGSTGACGCTTNESCGACSLTTGTVCDAAADCPAGETCITGTCGTDSYGRAACTAGPRSAITSSTQCPTATPILFCPPDDLVYLGCYNDVLRPGGFGSWPVMVRGVNCTGSGSARAHWPNMPCDMGTPTMCRSDSDCSSISADAECFGYTADSGASTDLEYPCIRSLAQTPTTPCTMHSTFCQVDSDCAGFGSGSWTCSENDAAAVEESGYCLPGTCPSGYTARSGKCWKDCSTDANCGGVSGSCVSSTCSGACSHPSNSTSCSVDADCVHPVVVSSPGGISRTYGVRGVDCVAGKCQCTGATVCDEHPDCPNVFQDFYAVTGDNYCTENLHAAQALIDALADTDGKPQLIVNTPVEIAEAACSNGFHYQRYTARTRERMVQEFPWVVDSYRLIRDTGQVGTTSLAICPSCTVGITHSDDVHQTALTGQLVGRANGTFLGTLGTCAAQSSTTGMWGPQKRCRNANFSFATTACTTSADCTAVQTCAPVRCQCVCRTSAECIAWWGSGHECVEANDNPCDVGDSACWCQRATDNVDSCDVIFDTGSQTWTCDTASETCKQAGTCTEDTTDTDCACGSAADACRVE